MEEQGQTAQREKRRDGARAPQRRRLRKKGRAEKRGGVAAAPFPRAQNKKHKDNLSKQNHSFLAHAGMYLAIISPKHMGGW